MLFQMVRVRKQLRGNTRIDPGPLPSWPLEEYLRECAGVMDVKRFDAMGVDGTNLVIYDLYRFEA